MYDLVQWFMMPSVAEGRKLANDTVYGRETHHLEGTTLTGTPAEREYHTLTAKTMEFVKDPRGYPWDFKTYDSKFIYDWVTEVNWSLNLGRDYKAFNPLLAMCPRYWDGDPYTNQQIIHPTSNYDVYQNCVKTSSANVQEVMYNIHAPVYMNFGGDVGETRTIIIEYYWDDESNRELIYLTRQFGWIYWQHQTFVNNNYKTDLSTLHNKIVPGGPPTTQFPCLAIP